MFRRKPKTSPRRSAGSYTVHVNGRLVGTFSGPVTITLPASRSREPLAPRGWLCGTPHLSGIIKYAR